MKPEPIAEPIAEVSQKDIIGGLDATESFTVSNSIFSSRLRVRIR